MSIVPVNGATQRRRLSTSGNGAWAAACWSGVTVMRPAVLVGGAGPERRRTARREAGVAVGVKPVEQDGAVVDEVGQAVGIYVGEIDLLADPGVRDVE